jgi:hypothetical protein
MQNPFQRSFNFSGPTARHDAGDGSEGFTGISEKEFFKVSRGQQAV